MDKLTVKEARQESFAGQTALLEGWVRSRRDSKAGFSFIELNDGTSLGNIQILAPNTLENYQSDVLRLTTGSSIAVEGEVVKSPGAKQPTEVHATKITVYGIADAVRAGEIFDVKFSTKSLGSADFYGKYLHSPQHPAYFYCLPQAYRFTYLVSDGVDVYEETYTPTWDLLEGYISYLMAYLKEADLWQLYCEKWEARE